MSGLPVAACGTNSPTDPQAVRARNTVPKIFKATYSGVPVFEFKCRGVAVMRRRADSFLNATQILKVADFDKPHRTRILERVVQTGEHEKVQGGYGKYQGTWVPFVRGIQIARQYKVEHHLRPLFEFSATGADSPPLAPKHVTIRTPVHHLTEVEGPRVRKRNRPVKIITNSPSLGGDRGACGETPASDDPDDSLLSDVDSLSANSSSSNDDSSRSESESQTDALTRPVKKKTRIVRQAGNKNYANILLNHFIADSYQVPKLLVNAPADLDMNLVIDDEGHTPLHWAAAMAKLKILKTLLQLGADPVCGNDVGQTALIRSVMFSNNFENRTFAEIFDILRDSVFTADRDNRTVLHHITLTAGCRGKVLAAEYYMGCLIDQINRSRENFSSLVNMVDVNGDTAVGIAARLANKRLVRLLLEIGADPTIKNRAGKSADDYATDMETIWQPCLVGEEDLNFDDDYGDSNFSSLTTVQYRVGRGIQGDASSVQMGALSRASSKATVNMAFQASKPATFKVVPALQKYFEQIGKKYEGKKKAVETDVKEVNDLLKSIQNDVMECRNVVNSLESQTSRFAETQEHINRLENQLCQQVYRNQMTILRSLVSQCESNNLQPETKSDGSCPPGYVQSLREKLSSLQVDRQRLVQKVLMVKSQSKPKQVGYHKLIATCCNIKIESVASLLRPLLDALGMEQTFG